MAECLHDNRFSRRHFAHRLWRSIIRLSNYLAHNMLHLRILLLAMLLGLHLPLAAQVYRSVDAEGNVTFSDQPTEGSEAVTIEQPNLSDPVKVPPAQPEPAVEPTPQVATESAPAPSQDQLSDDQYDNDGGAAYWGYRRHLDPVRPHPRHR